MSGRMNHQRASLRLADNRRKVAVTEGSYEPSQAGHVACPSFPKRSGSPTRPRRRRGAEVGATVHRRRRKLRKARNAVATGPSSAKPPKTKKSRKAQGKRLSRRARRAKRTTVGLNRIIVGSFSL